MREQNKDKDFFKVYNIVVDGGILANMNAKDLRVYLVLSRYANYNTRIAYPSVETISKLSGVNKNYIRQTVDRLEAMGLILRKRAGARFSFRNVYSVVSKQDINPDIALSNVPKNKDKCLIVERDSSGRIKAIRKTREKGLPSNGEGSFPEAKDVDIVPGDKERKEIVRPDKGRDISKGSPLPDSGTAPVGKNFPEGCLQDIAQKEGFDRAVDLQSGKVDRANEEFKRKEEKRLQDALEFFGETQ